VPNPSPISRHSFLVPNLSLAPIGGTPPRIAYRGVAGGMLFIDTVSGATSVTWYVSHDESGSLVPAADASGNALTVNIVAGKAYEIPGSLYGAIQISPVLNAGTATGKATLKS
jgi:hypothetical protein